MKKIVFMIIPVLIFGLVFKSCASDKITFQALVFLNQVVVIMEKNSINRYKIDWDDFRNEVFNTVPTAQTIDDTHPGIRKALSLLGDNHSFFETGRGIIWGSSIPYQKEYVSVNEIPDDVGYVKVTGNFKSNETDKNFASQIQNQIKQQDHSELKGWIVDLRNNGGGNCWPMLAGIGPILGEGIAGYFIYPDGNEQSWGYKNGASESNGHKVTRLSKSYKLLVPNPKVAVLLNSGVASSGEVIAVSFIGRENTKSFGSPTFGLSTSNVQFKLSGNTSLHLTTAYQADRNKKIYGVPINPDMISSQETIINDALAWIKGQ